MTAERGTRRNGGWKAGTRRKEWNLRFLQNENI